LKRSRSISSADTEPADTEAVFAALAHGSRRHILLVLRFRGGAMTAGEIADRFHCSWPTTSRHLRTLEQAGLVEVETRGRERVYRLASERLRAVTRSWLRWFEGKQRAATAGAPFEKRIMPPQRRARRR
jgi:DNA-binding transcriptional ArsR family regulator